MKILLTGAAGFIGSHTAERLLADGHTVLGLDNFDPYYSPRLKRRNLAAVERAGGGRFRLIEGDFGDSALTGKILREERCEAVIHLAAQAGVRPSLADPEKYERVNVGGLIRLLEAMRAYGPRRIVAASSSSVYGNTTPAPFREEAPCLRPQSPYGASKRAGEIYLGLYAQLHGFQTTLVRPFTVYGPRQRPDMAIASFARAILLRKPITLFGDGSSARDYTFISDIVAGLCGALACAAPFGIFNLGGEHPVALRDLVAALERAAGLKAEIGWAPLPPGDVERTCADLTLARRELKYEPRVRLEEGLERTLVWVKDELARGEDPE